jgi:hypothetical protein
MVPPGFSFRALTYIAYIACHRNLLRKTNLMSNLYAVVQTHSNPPRNLRPCKIVHSFRRFGKRKLLGCGNDVALHVRRCVFR